jgi:hypothetical protein
MWAKTSASMVAFFAIITIGYMIRGDEATVRKDLEAKYTEYAQFLETHPPKTYHDLLRDISSWTPQLEPSDSQQDTKHSKSSQEQTDNFTIKVTVSVDKIVMKDKNAIVTATRHISASSSDNSIRMKLTSTLQHLWTKTKNGWQYKKVDRDRVEATTDINLDIN